MTRLGLGMTGHDLLALGRRGCEHAVVGQDVTAGWGDLRRPIGPAIDLGVIGAPGCLWRLSGGVISLPLVITGSTATLSFGITGGTAIGMRFWNQAPAIDTGAGNALGVIMSDSARGYVGN